MFNNVMMVCIGNICRSPIAEAILQTNKPEINVYSSGLSALVGKPADPYSVELMSEKNIDLNSHCAQQINSVLVSSSDLILTMENKHIEIIQTKYPDSRGKVHLIGKWIDGKEVPDPYKKNKDAFIEAGNIIETGLKAWQEKIWP